MYGYTAEQIIEATKTDVFMRKEASLKGENRLTFIKNSAAYLNQCAFDGYVGEQKPEESPVIGGTFNI